MAWKVLDSEGVKYVSDSFIVGALVGQAGHIALELSRHILGAKMQ